MGAAAPSFSLSKGQRDSGAAERGSALRLTRSLGKADPCLGEGNQKPLLEALTEALGDSAGIAGFFSTFPSHQLCEFSAS